MDPPEKALRPDTVEPRDGLVGNFVAGAVDAAQRERLILAQIEVVEIGLKPLGDSPLVIEDVSADESTGAESRRLQPLGNRRLGLVKKKPAVVAYAVCWRKRAGENRGMRRQRQRRRRNRLLEQDTVVRQSVEVGCLHTVESIRVNAIGSRCIQRDDQKIEIRRANANGQMT